ncbi:MAG: zinc/manganese transport system substrate-binding protein [Paraglaciecola sp.]|jgi:zinc/manganese transport system substrate-binding protein
MKILNKLHKYMAVAVLMGLSGQVSAELQIFACEPEWASLAEELGGDKVTAYSATTGLQDPHHIQARPSLIAKIRNADMLACTGAELEIGWLPLLLQRASNSNIQPGKPGHFLASEHVRLLGIAKRIDRSQGDVHASGNPHIQTNPANIKRIAKAMNDTLQQLDNANAAYYQQRFDDFNRRWKVALRKWKTMLRPLKNSDIVVHHNSWLYLQDWLDLNNVATLEDKPGIPPSSGHLVNILELMKTQPVRMIVRAAYQSDRAALWLSAKTDIPIVVLPFTIGGNEQAVDLFSLYDNTFEMMLKAAKL